MLTLAGLVLTASMAQAADLSGTIGQLEDQHLKVSEIRWRLTQHEQRVQAMVSADTAVIDDWLLSGLDYRCPDLRWSDKHIACRGGGMLLTVDALGLRPEGSVDWRYHRNSGQIDFSADLALLDGELSVEGSWGEVLAIQGRLDWALPALAAAFGLDGQALGLGGRLQAQFDLTLSADDVVTKGNFRTQQLAFDALAGRLAAADLVIAGDYQVALSSAGLRFETRSRLMAGDLLLGLFYLPLSQLPTLNVVADGLRAPDGSMTLEHLALSDGEGFRLSGDGRLTADAVLQSLSVDIEHLLLPALMQRYLSGGLEAAGWAGLAAEGGVSGSLQWADGELRQLALSLQEVALSDSYQRLNIAGLRGTLHYQGEGDGLLSQLDWDGIEVYRIGFGAARMELLWSGSQVRLTQPLAMPVFDGGLDIAELSVSYGGETTSVDFQATLRPIALAPVSVALGWPELRGTVSGQIPKLRLRQGVWELGGAIELDVFDGGVTLQNLRLERLFGVLPTVAADIDIDNIDLELMTSAFSFGRIEGRLGGAVKGLRLLDWEPVAFDLRLATPEGDRSRHRISQRALDNLSAIGGGGALLASPLLRVFDDFSYAELGLSCALSKHVCRMGGVAPADSGSGYYIVRGSGLPRINVVGYAERVDWPQLVRRLQQATRSGAARVQ